LLRYAIAFALLATASPTLAGTVSGSLKIDKAKHPSPPERSRGYVARTPHPLLAGKPVENPFPSMFVVLSGGDLGEDAATPARRPVELELVGQRFARDVFPVMVGQLLLIKNVSKRTANKGVTPRIDAPGNRDVFANPGDAGTPINHNGERELTLKKAFSPVELRDLDSIHLRTKLVGVPHKHFAAPNRAGKFELTDVPAGSWTVRVWYKDGWLWGAERKVTVTAKGKATVNINIPPAMQVEAAGK
jgi:hypothetical protein